MSANKYKKLLQSAECCRGQGSERSIHASEERRRRGESGQAAERRNTSPCRRFDRIEHGGPMVMSYKNVISMQPHAKEGAVAHDDDDDPAAVRPSRRNKRPGGAKPPFALHIRTTSTIQYTTYLVIF